MTDIAAAIREHLAGILLALPVEDWPGLDDNLFDSGMDSLSVVRLLVFVEREFDVRLPDNELTADNLKSVRAIARWVETHRQRRR